VALKVLPAGTLADEAARKRFGNEAVALSKLTHPNIAIVYDFDTHDGVDFLVMEYLPGETLDARLAAGPLPETNVARLGMQIAEGLASAHAKGVIHRDLKPGNLRVTPEGHLKILDFGLAKLLPRVGEKSQVETASNSHAVSGTLPYMAPEQLRGENVDARTDIFSLGAVLYEMATGKRPFREETSPRLIDAILHQTPVTPRAVNPRVSPDLERIVLKSLEKDPALRYQSATEVGVDLRRLGTPSGAAVAIPAVPPGSKWRAMGVMAALGVAAVLVLLIGLDVGGLRERLFGGASASRIESLAVLPLENLSGDPEQDYFSDGMTDALITDLSRIKTLRVISRTSTMRYKATDKPLPEIAQELDVDAVVEGSVLRVGDRVRITAQLIEAGTDRHLLAESYERDLTDILALQGEVARAIAEKIRIALTPQDTARFSNRRQVDQEAHETYLKGRLYLNEQTDEGYWKAIDYFNQAIARDPGYAPAYAGLADSYSSLGWSALPPHEAFPKAKAAVFKALEIDDTLSEAHASLGYIRTFYDWDWSAAERDFKRAIELNPNSVDAHVFYHWCLRVQGRLAESQAEIARAYELDPLSTYLMAMEDSHYTSGQYHQAIDRLREVLDLDPTLAIGHWWLGLAYLQEAMYNEAIAAFQEALALSEASTEYLAWLGRANAMAGRRDKALQIIDELNARSKQEYIASNHFATIYIGLGDKDKAFEWLEKTYEERSGWMVWLQTAPEFDSLRSDPRFADLLRRMGFPPP
jgi:serine/threonine-protein kinase